MPTKPRATSPNAMARDARAVEMLAQGREVGDVARELGIALITAKRIHSKYRREIEAAAKARFEGVRQGAERAKALLADSVEDAARGVIEIGKRARAGKLKKDIQVKAATLELKSYAMRLDRGGVPAKSEIDHGGKLADQIGALLAESGGVTK
jgi:hypothetical protein